jgi:hypothetical protein
METILSHLYAGCPRHQVAGVLNTSESCPPPLTCPMGHIEFEQPVSVPLWPLNGPQSEGHRFVH